MAYRKDRLYFAYNKRQKDFMYRYPTKSDGHLLYWLFNTLLDGKNIIQELEDRGYDTTTIRFRITKKKEASKPKDIAG